VGGVALCCKHAAVGQNTDVCVLEHEQSCGKNLGGGGRAGLQAAAM
jgi:hypothetical protein